MFSIELLSLAIATSIRFLNGSRKGERAHHKQMRQNANMLVSIPFIV